MTGKYTITELAKTLSISRQALYKKGVGQRRFYQRKQDMQVLEWIKEITKSRPTYGYKRVTAMVNKGNGVKLNKKRIYRLMKHYGLLLPKNKVERIHTGTGKVMVLHSNTRWCSDAFEIKCFDGQKVYVAFSLDCKDREAISFIASKSHLKAHHIETLMLTSVEKRFGQPRAPRALQWLTDRGSIYRAESVRELARHLGIKQCYTAAYSPSSNGMAESFVGTIKRDYVYMNDCYNPDQVIKMLQEWFDDYNNVAPHSALDMLSPREYLQKIQL
jgi:putative transposase